MDMKKEEVLIHADHTLLNVCTVTGFPLGYSTTETKVYGALVI
ncbi:hypothetical protein [Lacrimispora brassicae]